MKTQSKQELLREIEELQEQLSEAKETLRAIRNGEIDAVAEDLTEREQVEQTRSLLTVIREEKERLSALINSIDDEVWFADTQERFILINPSVLREFGFASTQELEVEKLVASLEVYRPDGSPRPVEEAPALRALKGEVIRNQEEMVRNPASGELRYREVSAAPVRDVRSIIVGSVSIVRDITERKRKEQALQEAHERARSSARFPEENPNPVLRVSAEGQILYRNAAAADLPGWAGEVGQAIADSHLALIKQAMAEDRELRQDMELGGRVYSVALLPFPAEGYANVYGTDVTERKRAEEEILDRAAQLEATFGALRDAVLIYDTGMNVKRVNPSFLSSYGFDPVGLNLAEIVRRVSCRHLDGRPLVLEDQPTPLALRGESVTSAHFLITRPDGTDAVIETSSGPMRMGRRIIGSATVWHDITEDKLGEQAVRDSEARFKLLSEMSGRLLAAEDPQETLSDLCRAVKEHLDCQACFQFLVDEESGRLYLSACSGIPEQEACKIEWLDYGMAVSGCAARDRVRIVVEDILNVSAPRTELVKSYGIQAYACHPLIAGGRVLGTLSFGTRTRTHFSPQDLALMKTVADQVATAIERKRLLRELNKSREELEIRVRERTEELLKANLALQEQASLLDLAHDAIIVRDLHDRIVYWNRGAEKTYEWLRDEVLGKVIHDVLQTRFPKPLDETQTCLVEDGKWEGELQHTARHGYLMTVTSRQALQRNADGEPTGILEINRDITEHKQAEEEISQARAMLQMVFDGISDPLFMLGGDLSIKMLNQAACRYFHVGSIHETGGRTCHDLTHGKCLVCDDCEIRQAISSGRDMTFERRGLFDPDSIEQVTVYPLDESTTGTSGAIVGITDITESRKLEEHMIRVNRLSSLGQLSAGIAHEIRNPLAGINLFVDVLSDDEKFQRTSQELDLLGEIKHNIKKMDGIIKRVLDFSRQAESVTQNNLDVGLLLDETLKIWRSAMGRIGIKLSLLVEENLPHILGDSIELQQVLNNLVQNAVDAMSQGGSLSITARAGVSSVDKNRRSVIISVQDTGPGIPLEHQESIFNPFYTTKSAGTGLGLAISHRIVTRHGGTIFFESTPNVGTTFQIEFPTASGD
jgi:PAS domain S-box-containing protein